jgi:Fic family protein
MVDDLVRTEPVTSLRIQDPRSIQLDGSRLDLLVQVTESQTELEGIGAFSNDVTDRVRRALLPDRVVSSLNLEGIVATRRVTLQIMDAMRVEETAERAEREVYNLLRANEFIEELVDQGVQLSLGMIRQLHGILMAGVLGTAGQFRSGFVDLPGAPFRPPAASDVPGLVEEIALRFGQSEGLHPMVQAAWLHDQITMVHPYDDGNGRCGRLLQDWALIRRGLVPIGIPVSTRDDYYAALEKADTGSWGDLVELLATLELSVLSKVKAIAKEPEARAAWVERLAEAASRKYRDTRHRRFLVWQQRNEDLVNRFEVAASEIDESSREIGVSFKRYPALDFRDWLQVAEEGRFSRTWQFGLLFFAEGEPVWKAIFFARRHQPAGCDPVEISMGTVGLHVTGQPAAALERPELLHWTDPHIRLRELIYVEDSLFRYRIDEDGTLTCDTDVPVADAVRDFFLEVFERKLGLGA